MKTQMPGWPEWRSVLAVSSAVATTMVLTVALAGSVRGTSAYSLDPDRSRALITVGKAGVLSFAAGHTHQVVAPLRGTLTVDLAHLDASGIDIEIRTAELTVTGEGEPPQDVPKVQETMAGPSVLDVNRYPTITFRSTSVTPAPRRGSGVDLSITGDLTLRGVTQRISVPIHADVAPGTITAHGTLSVKQTDYGMKPVSVAGVVSVRDRLDISVAVTASE